MCHLKRVGHFAGLKIILYIYTLMNFFSLKKTVNVTKILLQGLYSTTFKQ